MYSTQAESGVWQFRDLNNIHVLLLIRLHVPQSVIEIMNVLDPDPLVDLLSVLRHDNDYGYYEETNLKYLHNKAFNSKTFWHTNQVTVFFRDALACLYF